jgi:hypothetical protein
MRYAVFFALLLCSCVADVPPEPIDETATFDSSQPCDDVHDCLTQNALRPCSGVACKRGACVYLTVDNGNLCEVDSHVGMCIDGACHKTH